MKGRGWGLPLAVLVAASTSAIASYWLAAAFGGGWGDRLAIVAALGLFCVVAGRLVPRSPGLVAMSAGVLVPISAVASIAEVDPRVVGMGEWCGTGRLSQAFTAAITVFPIALGLGAFGAYLQRSAKPGRLPHHAPTVLLALTVTAAAIVGVARLATRGDVAAFRAGFGAAAPAEVTCRGKDLGCTVDPEDGAGVRAVFAVRGDDGVLLSRHRVAGVWRVEKIAKDGEALEIGGIVAGSPEPVGELHASDLPGWIAPPWQSVALGAAGLALLALTSLWIARGRRGLALLARGRAVAIDADGFVELDGARLRVEDPPTALPAQALLLSRRDRGAWSYRDTPVVAGRSLVPGTLAELEQAFAERVRRWRPLLVVAALVLAAPCVVAALSA